MRIKNAVIIASALAIAGLSVLTSGQVTACFVEITKSCGSFWTNTSRVCQSGAVGQPCPDLNLTPGSTFTTIGVAGLNEHGLTDFDAQCNNVQPSSAMIMFGRCVNAACEYSPPTKRQCINACTHGYPCTGPTQIQ